MNNFKSWLQSRTIWMAIVAIAPLLSAKAGFDLPATLNDLLEIVGTAGVIYFRITAKKKLQSPAN